MDCLQLRVQFFFAFYRNSKPLKILLQIWMSNENVRLFHGHPFGAFNKLI